MKYVYAVEVIIAKRENFGASKGLQFSTARIQAPGHLDEFFPEKADALSFMRDWLDTHRGEARIATFRVQDDGYPVAQTDDSLRDGRAWLGELNGYAPDLTAFIENLSIPYGQGGRKNDDRHGNSPRRSDPEGSAG